MNYRLAVIAALAVPAAACATVGESDAAYGLYRGGTIGAGLGAVVGQATGQGMGTGALAGAVVGGALGAAIATRKEGHQNVGVTVNGVQYYRDTEGRCYYIDQAGNPVYDIAVRC